MAALWTDIAGGVDHLTAGTKLPDIELPSSSGGAFNLAHLQGKAIVFIYTWTGRPGVPNPPHWDDIPGAHGSSSQATGFRDRHADYARIGYDIYGLSTQDPDFQAEFAGRTALNFPLLSDARGDFARALYLPAFETGGAVYLKRLTLIVSRGSIDRVIYPIALPKQQAGELLTLIEADPNPHGLR